MDLPMTVETRNARVVVLLVAAMTLTGAVLLALEPRRPASTPGESLMAARSSTVDGLIIEYVPPWLDISPGAYDCAVTEAGEAVWKPRGEREIRMAVMPPATAELPEAQKRAILLLIHSLRAQRGLDLGRIRLHPDSDPRLRGDLGPQAESLLDLLVRKGFIE
jgi:hypothetical protein